MNGRDSIFPRTFSVPVPSDAYFGDPLLLKLAEFFEGKGLKTLKDEDQSQVWYPDWIAYQASHHLYAGLLSPREFSAHGCELNLLRLCRFLEVFAYCSPAHGYSLQVTFLGLFPILMSSNLAMKKEAISSLENGAIFALGVSEKDHGSDLLASEFTVTESEPGKWKADGKKYYIGNANAASIITILARKVDERRTRDAKRAMPVLFALRPGQSKSFGKVKKIPTLGIRSAFVGEFEVKHHEFPNSDLISQGRDAWEAVLGTVNLGKFFLGFGSIGICERAFEEAIGHMTHRVLFGKPVLDMPHLAAATAQAFARLTAMKLYAFRALDYLQSAGAEDRRFLLFNAVQKARTGTEGVKVMSLLGECVGAFGFQAETYFEMALRDIQLIPLLEGSAHINLALTAQFVAQYFKRGNAELPEPPSLAAGERETAENPYLFQSSVGAAHTVAFGPFRKAYKPLKDVPNVRIFARQAKAFGRFARGRFFAARAADTQSSLAIGQCVAIIAYGQLVAENCARFDIAKPMISAMFHMLVSDLGAAALAMAALPQLDVADRKRFRRLAMVPITTSWDWEFVLQRAKGMTAQAVGN